MTCMIKAKFYFTLLEIVIATTIMLLISSLAVVRFAGSPPGAVMEKTSRELEQFFTYGSHLATLKGKTVTIEFQPDKNAFFIIDEQSEGNSGNRKFLMDRTRTFILPKDVKIKFSGHKPFLFLFYADGTAAGQEFTVVLDDRENNFNLSSLTGQLRRCNAEMGQGK